jgi:hypothetical protein
MQTYRIIVDGRAHQSGLTLDDVVEFCQEAHYDAPSLVRRLLRAGCVKLSDEIGNYAIEREREGSR